ncbi:MAG: hypothetical protein SGPRY_000744 [Prymnesium sp.]
MLALHPIDLLAAAPLSLNLQRCDESRESSCSLVPTDTDYHLSLPIPGVSPADLSLTVRGRTLSIAGESTIGREVYSASHRLRLPSDARVDTASARLEHGILCVRLPRHAPTTQEIHVLESVGALPAGSEEDYMITLAVPGLRPTDIRLSASNGLLCVQAEGQVAGQSVRISKCIRLEADADVSSASAAVENGVLAIHLRKSARHVEIKVNGEVADGDASSSKDGSSV